MARIGGNPDLKEHQFTTDRAEPCSAKLSVRIQPSLLEKLQSQDNWQELVRQAIAEKLNVPIATVQEKAPKQSRGRKPKQD